MAYDNETYLASLAQSRGDIDRHVQNAQAEVTRQQGVANQQASLIPQTTGNIAAGSAARSVGDAAAVGGMLRQGIGSMAQGGPLARSNQGTLSALGQQQGAFSSAAPLLQQGIDEQALGRQSSVRNIGAQLNNDVDMRMYDYIAGREAEDRGYAAQSSAQQAAQAHAATLAAQQIAAAQAEAEAQRLWEGDQSAEGRLFQLLLANPLLGPSGQSTIPSTAAGTNRAF